MSDRIDPPHWPSQRGPWPAVSDASRLFDHGWPWCVNAAGHPDPDGGYRIRIVICRGTSAVARRCSWTVCAAIWMASRSV